MTAAEYDAIYSDATAPPWEIGAPQPALARMLDGKVNGPKVLDIGCGTGELALALARRGYDVTAVDISPVAIEKARAKAAVAGLTVHFEVQDATRLSLPQAPFNSLFDSGLLHSLNRRSRADVDAYLNQLPDLAAPGATVFVLAISLEASQGWGVTAEMLREFFPEPTWTGTEIDAIDVAAELDGKGLILRGFLLRTTRACG